MPKTLTGEELQLDDGPVKGAELFLVDGNNLAYRAFFALPEELQTTDGQPTNALLGFTNMLFKLLSDYGPRGVAVAWDTRPTHRTEIAETYKEGRRPMPDLLREQFPHFRPIVEAFGYSNLEFEGWEADDVIATLATRADEAGIRTCVVSTDRDAFQLCSENVSLMMTPRGVADVHVYTPERVELRYGVRPDQVPDFIGLKGDTSDNIPGIPGIGDKTAGQLIAQYGSLEEVIDHAGELSPARSKAVVEHADQARASKVLATMQRDLPLDVERRSARRVAARSLHAQGDLPPLRVPRPAEPGRHARRGAAGGRAASRRIRCTSPGARGRSSRVRAGRRRRGRRRVASRPARASWSRRRPRRDELRAPSARPRSRRTTQRRSGSARVRRRHDDRRVPRRSRAAPATSVDDLAREYGLELVPEPATEEETAALVRRAEAARRLAPTLRARLREWGMEPLYDEIELPLTGVLADMEDAGIRIDTYRMGEITARLAERVEELEASALELAGEEFQLGSTQQLARILFEKLGLTSGRKGKTGYSTDARVLRAIRDDHAIVPVVEEWRELTKLLNTYLLPLPELIDDRDGRLHTTINQAVAATGRLSTTNPNLQSIPVRTELGRRIRSAFVAADGTRLLSADYSQVELRILAHVSGEPVLREAFARGEDIHAATASQVFGIPQAELSRGQRDTAKMVNFGIIYGISSFGLSENLGIPREEAQELIDTYLARLPRVQELIKRTIAQAAADGYVTTLLGRRRPIPELRASNRQTRSLGERLAVNTVMQGTAADVIKVAMVRIHERLRARGPCGPARAPGARRAPARGAGRRDERRPRPRPRGDGRRVPARPARLPSTPGSATPGRTRRSSVPSRWSDSASVAVSTFVTTVGIWLGLAAS